MTSTVGLNSRFRLVPNHKFLGGTFPTICVAVARSVASWYAFPAAADDPRMLKAATCNRNNAGMTLDAAAMNKATIPTAVAKSDT